MLIRYENKTGKESEKKKQILKSTDVWKFQLYSVTWLAYRNVNIVKLERK